MTADPTEPIEGRARKPRGLWRSLLGAGLVAAVIVVDYTSCRPKYTTVIFDGRKHDILAVTRATMINVSPECGTLRFNELLVKYITTARDSISRRQEADDLLQFGSRYARYTGDSLLVIQQARFPFTRWVDATLTYDMRFARQPTGIFVRMEDVWPPWATCYKTGQASARPAG